MTKTIISFDIDDVIFRTGIRLIKMAFATCGKDYFPPRDWNMSGYPQDVKDEFYRLVFKSEHLFTGRLCHKRIRYCLNQLLDHPKYGVVFVTARSGCQLNATVGQFDRCGINVPEDIIYPVGQGGSKVDTLKKLKPMLHFDDAPYHVQDCVGNGINTVMISNEHTPYNHYLRGKVPTALNIVRALREYGIVR